VPGPTQADKNWDAFISHASEDKDGFVRPLAHALRDWGCRIWFDEFSLRLGDSLSQSIDQGLALSRFGVVVLSRAFMSKPWTQHELAGLVTRQIGGESRILPIWHGVSREEVSAFSPTLADRLAVRTDDADPIDIALQILTIVRPDLYEGRSRKDLVGAADPEALAQLQEELDRTREQLADFQCPYCSSLLVRSIDAPVDEEERDWDIRREFECGYREFAGQAERLCSSDPRFPKFEDYELLFQSLDIPAAPDVVLWHCSARPKTDGARMVPLYDTTGGTKEAAALEMKAEFERAAERRG